MYKIAGNIFVVIILSMSTTLFASPNQKDKSLLLFDLPLSELMNIEISTAGKTNEKIKDIPASLTIITRSDIKRYGYTTLTEVLENAPGLYNIYSYTGTPGNFGLRGFWNQTPQNSNIAILVNGVRQFNDDLRSQPMAKINLPVEAIDQIEIIKGPMAVIYGNNASLGVINIITNKASSSDDDTLVSFMSGSSSTNKVALRISEQGDDHRFVVNASHFNTNGLDNEFSDMTSPTNQASFPLLGVTNPNYSTNGLLEHESDYLGISGSLNDLYFDYSYNQTDVEVFAIAPSLENGIQQKTTANNMMLGYKTDINNWINIDGKLVYSPHKVEFDLDIIDTTLPGTQSTKYDAWEAEILVTFTPTNKTTIVTGLNQRTMTNFEQKFNIPALNLINPGANVNSVITKSNRTTQSLFSQVTYSTEKNLVLIAGIRWENHLDYTSSGTDFIGTPSEVNFIRNIEGNDYFLPRLATIYHVNNSNTIKLLYGEADKLVDDNTSIPESTETIEINHIYNSDYFSLSNSLFRNQLEDLFIEDIVTLPGGGLGLGTSREGELVTYGIETALLSHHNKNLVSELSVTFQKSEEKNLNIKASYSPSTVAHAKLAYSSGRAIYSALARYIGAMEAGFDKTTGNRVGESIDDYQIMDLHYRRDRIFSKAYLSLKLNNIFDQEIRYPTTIEFNELLDRGTLGPGRSFYATLGWVF